MKEVLLVIRPKTGVAQVRVSVNGGLVLWGKRSVGQDDS